ncbi:MAG: ImmA/IrrE family metallo-endopeptidase, partial [Elusimicrobia bacterium]|nr:ImmA/IrrE family metallo-endopeptidase [Elusimicrobiota bacterium]
AHEAAHAVLHRDYYSKFSYTNEEGWVRLVQAINERDFKNLEWQAEAFAALVCVPKQALKRHLQNYIQRASREGIDVRSSGFLDRVGKALADVFEIQPAMIRKRIEQDGLLPPANPGKWEFGPPA